MTMTSDAAGFGAPVRDRVTGHVLFGLLASLALVGGVTYWGTATTLSGAVIATGTVEIQGDLKEVQHRDGGIVADIAVKDGQQVEAGQVLLRLDDAQTRAEQGIVLSQLRELEGRRARLLAERDGLAAIRFPADFDVPDPGLALLMAGEIQLFAGNVLGRTRQKEQLSLQEEQLGQETAGLRSQLDALSDEIALVEDEHSKLSGLADDGFIEGSRVSSLSRELTRMLGQRGEIEASMARAGARQSEVQLQKLAIDETARTDAQRELRQIDASMAELNERYLAVTDRLSRTDIRAPIAGTINELNVSTIGGVVTPAETLVTIVPAGATLKVEVRLRVTDVDQIAVGDPAKLRFSAFNQRTTPELTGRVTRVAAAAQYDSASGASFYLGEITIDAHELTNAGLDLRPGMPVEAFVETEAMTPLAYLAKPFTDQLARAFREE